MMHPLQFNNRVALSSCNRPSLKKIADAKTIIEKIYDKFHDTDDKDLKEIVESYIAPLLSLSTSHWLSFEPLKPILDRIEAPITRVHERDHFIVPRYFLRLEDEINELGILYIRRIVSSLHTDIIKGAFLLLCIGSLSFLLVAILPHTPISNLISIAISVSIIVFAVLEMLLLVSYLMQEAFEELPDYEQADMEDPIT